MYIHPIDIENLHIKNNLFLAPMAGVTDMPFRKLCKEFGAGMMYTEMASSNAIHYGSEKTKEIYEIFVDEHPIGIQIFGSNPDTMGETAERLSRVADIIDINMGCPANKIIKNNEGSALMKDLKLAERVIKKVVTSSKVPVTVKMRKGWDKNNVCAVELAKIAEASGASLVTVHGRTREDMYSGKVDFNIIRDVKSAVKIPVIGNGDIVDGESAEKMFEYTGCDGIMIGRGSQGNPWIFRNVLDYFNGNSVIPPNKEDKIRMAIRHLKLEIGYKGEYTGIREMRKHLSSYLKGMPSATEMRDKIYRAEKAEKVIEILNKSLSLGETL